MRKSIVFLIIFGWVSLLNPVQAQSTDGQDALKKHVNTMVKKVEKADDAGEKRVILDESLGKLMKAMDRVRTNAAVSETDKEALSHLKRSIKEKKDELNGLNGFAKVPDRRLDQFAQYVQQDMEQADAVTLSLTTVLLIVIILLLL